VFESFPGSIHRMKKIGFVVAQAAGSGNHELKGP
jgi:hypothetical protein